MSTITEVCQHSCCQRLVVPPRLTDAGWWELDILHHRLFRADLGTVGFDPVPPGGPTACVWELLAVDHERQAWVDHVLVKPEAPDIPGYLAAAFAAAP